MVFIRLYMIALLVIGAILTLGVGIDSLINITTYCNEERINLIDDCTGEGVEEDKAMVKVGSYSKKIVIVIALLALYHLILY